MALIAMLIGKAVYEKKPDEALFWCSVFARRERNALSQATRQELQALLDDSTRWLF
ncbi:hypothetical protein WOC76_20920 [Methylocystis sp. IM3]|uniref:hypothetical protein n=1 Tax=unclassified Methylocystis TaxID=2625913 RepID=UPI0030FA5708